MLNAFYKQYDPNNDDLLHPWVITIVMIRFMFYLEI